MRPRPRVLKCVCRQKYISGLPGTGQAMISLSVPSASAVVVADAIKGVLTLAGHNVRRINSEGEEVVSADEIFPDASPAMALRGFRGKMEWTQQELAEKLGRRKIAFPPWKAASVAFP